MLIQNSSIKNLIDAILNMELTAEQVLLIMLGEKNGVDVPEFIKALNKSKIIQNISLLYELALATGQSLDLKESCDIFLKRLMGRKNLIYSAVWIKDDYLTRKEQQQTATLIYAFPEHFPQTKKISLDHPLFAALNEKEFVKISSYEKEFREHADEKGVSNGTIVLISLEQIGVLKLFSVRDDCFSDYELNQLRKVFSKFAYSLKGCLFHKQLLTEIEERKRTEQALKQSEQQLAYITEQKKIEAQHALSQKLQSVGELAAGIAHEINTPMQYIGDNTRFLQNAINDIIYDLLVDYKKLKNKAAAEKNFGLLVNQISNKEEELDVTYLLEEIPRAFEETLEGIGKVNKLVLAMKDFVHPGEKEMKFANINKAIEGTVTISRNEWKYVAELETDLEPGLPLVCCVIDEINQVLLNMILNAAQAIKEAPKSRTLTKGKITVTTKNDGDYVTILLSGNGIGIPKEMVNKIFEPFFTTKEVGKGTGQGLAIAYNIIATKHEGSIEVDSEVGKGTVFTIRLPINPKNNTG